MLIGPFVSACKTRENIVNSASSSTCVTLAAQFNRRSSVALRSVRHSDWVANSDLLSVGSPLGDGVLGSNRLSLAYHPTKGGSAWHEST